MVERNPTYIPGKVERQVGCPKCRSKDYDGCNMQGSIVLTCRACKQQWLGGYHPAAPDPRYNSQSVRPPDIEFVVIRNGMGIVSTEEIRRPVNLNQAFRGGAPIPRDGEEENV